MPHINKYGVIIEQYNYDETYYKTYDQSTNLITFNIADKKLEKSNSYNIPRSIAGHYECRGTYIGDVIYTVTGPAVTAYNLESGTKLAGITVTNEG